MLQKQRVESLSGSRFTSLMYLEYFDCIRLHIIDAMHNPFLGYSPMLTIEEAEQGHDLLVKFCIEFETLCGIEKVTPNMHCITHLVECIMDYGPVYAFWLF